MSSPRRRSSPPTAKDRYNVYFQDHVHNITWEADINDNGAPVVEALAELNRHRA